MLRNWLVGVNNNHIQCQLLAKGDLLLDRAIELALGLEVAAKNMLAIQGACLLDMDRSSPVR